MMVVRFMWASAGGCAATESHVVHMHAGGLHTQRGRYQDDVGDQTFMAFGAGCGFALAALGGCGWSTARSQPVRGARLQHCVDGQHQGQ
ncbi:hypothetical protein L1887_58429 [Cichorium endivia]|nr:hypothetical protein L1887_58429 [Cichorium endivia]